MRSHPIRRARLSWATATLLAWTALGLGSVSHAGYVTSTLAPSSLSTKTGSTDANNVDVLAVKDQPSPAGKSAGVRVFKPSTKGYEGILSYPVPSTLDVKSASGLTVNVQYLGDGAAWQLWQFQLHDFSGGNWVTVGDNSTAKPWQWSSMSFAASGDFARFVSGDRRLELRFVTKGVKRESDLDLATVAVTTYAADPAPAPGPVPPSGAKRSAGAVRTVFQGSFTSTPDTVEYLANVPDLHVLSCGPSKVASLKAANSSVMAHHYMKLAGLHGPATRGPSGDPGWDQAVADDLLWMGPSGKPVTQTQNGWYYIDIQNPTKRSKWIDLVFAQIEDFRSQGYDGVFFDNAGVIEPSLINEYPADYDKNVYYAAVHEVLSAVRLAYPGMPVLFNSYSGWADRGLRGLELLSSADGLYFEGFSTKVSGKFFDPARFQQQLDDYASVLASGKKAVAMDYVASTNLAGRIWSLASYLLVNGRRGYHYIAATDATTEVTELAEDQLDLGAPLAAAVVRSDGLITRAYPNVTVIVNPNTSSRTYDLGTGNWQSLALSGGGDYPSAGSLSWPNLGRTSVILAANTAAIVRLAP